MQSAIKPGPLTALLSGILHHDLGEHRAVTLRHFRNLDRDAARDLFTRLLAAKPVAAASANTELTVAERQRIERCLEAQDPAAATSGGE